jgi:DNA-binding response OmpR family regulator
MTPNPLAATDPSRKTILVVEDDESTAQAVAWHLSKAGFATTIARDGLAALTTLKAWTPDAVVLDLMLPHVDGWSIIRDVRRWAPQLPIIVMTARPDEGERLEALTLGADDLLRKPFSAKELVARLDTALRRAEVLGTGDPAEASMGDMVIDRDRLQVRIADDVAPLTPLETKLLWILAEEKGRTISRDEIFTRVWGGERPHGDRSVDVLVRRLRRKVDESGGNYTYVQTEHRVGYRLEAIPKAFPVGRRPRR